MSLYRSSLGFVLWWLGSILLLASDRDVSAHEGHSAATYRVTRTGEQIEHMRHLRVKVVDENGRRVAARLTLAVDGKSSTPAHVGEHGLRVTSIHQRRKQTFTAIYSRGTGDVLIPLPASARKGSITAAKGFEYKSPTALFDLEDERQQTVTLQLKRWVDLQSMGWHAADCHLHYERTAAKHDRDWLTMLDGDGLSHAHFLVLRGGNLPGVWAQQFAYGRRGEANDGKRWIRPGEEYRDSTQGHINLLGVTQVIEPISTGGIGLPKIPFNYPPLTTVFDTTHRLGGIGGPAHGASLARSSTAVLDTVLGRVDFIEIANTHLYKTDVWYQLLSCGYIIPPTAGTDLPNFGFRDSWQPFFGEVRTYVRSGAEASFESWKQGIRRGEVFVTSGPIIQLEANGKGPGGTVQLSKEEGSVSIKASLSSPRELKSLELIIQGQPVELEVKRGTRNGIQALTIQHNLPIKKSSWIAVRGVGMPKVAVERGLRISQPVMAHSGIIQVLVGDEPIRSKAAIEKTRKQLIQQQEYYRTKANYEKPEHRLEFVKLFDEALKKLGSPSN